MGQEVKNQSLSSQKMIYQKRRKASVSEIKKAPVEFCFRMSVATRHPSSNAAATCFARSVNRRWRVFVPTGAPPAIARILVTTT